MNDKKSTNSSPILPDLNVLNIKSSKLGRVATLHGKGGGPEFFLYVEKTVWRVVLLRVNTQILSTVDSK
jgi:hypothetical protein